MGISESMRQALSFLTSCLCYHKWDITNPVLQGYDFQICLQQVGNYGMMVNDFVTCISLLLSQPETSQSKTSFTIHNLLFLCEIWRSHSGTNEDSRLPVHDAVQTCTKLLIYQSRCYISEDITVTMRQHLRAMGTDRNNPNCLIMIMPIVRMHRTCRRTDSGLTVSNFLLQLRLDSKTEGHKPHQLTCWQTRHSRCRFCCCAGA